MFVDLEYELYPNTNPNVTPTLRTLNQRSLVSWLVSQFIHYCVRRLVRASVDFEY
jgi:hypothetical protein